MINAFVFHLAASIGDICFILNDFSNIFCHFNFLHKCSVHKKRYENERKDSVRSTCKSHLSYIWYWLEMEEKWREEKNSRNESCEIFLQIVCHWVRKTTLKLKTNKHETMRREKLIISEYVCSLTIAFSIYSALLVCYGIILFHICTIST